MMGLNHQGSLKDLTDKTTSLEKRIETVAAKQLSANQDVTRNTGRLNKVELDMKEMDTSISNVEREQGKVRKASETDIGNLNKQAG